MASLPMEQSMEPTSAEANTDSPPKSLYPDNLRNLKQFLLPLRADERIVAMVASLPRRGQLMLLEAITRNMNTHSRDYHEPDRASELEQYGQDNEDRNWNHRDIGIDGCIVSCSRVASISTNHPGPSYIWSSLHLPLARVPHRLSDGAPRSFLRSFIYPYISLIQSVTSPQIGRVPSNLLEEQMRSLNRIDALREQCLSSVLLINRLDGGTSRSSSSLWIATARNGGQSRLVFEDILLLGQSSFNHVADLHDQHEDLRMDVDNMSYEELLALEDSIGYVDTGLDEEMVIESLKHSKYLFSSEKNACKQSCSICQEEFVEEDEVAALDCGHDFHAACIKQWLKCKNLCPVCKSTGLITSDIHFPTD